MKLFTVLVLASLSISSFAQTKDENFDKMKSMMTENLDKRISHLQTAKSCVSSATTKEQLHECRKTLRTSMKGMKKDAEGKRDQWRAEKRKNKKDKK